ncbi:F-box/SPRY domain-containing protein 1 isoform X1 [Rana temporaria]|uniref:F-box/SPRY domain-containing protein 1 isoform X1 n=1 Tax=Rana temporaria TaxID=8407 RepID=UPI001AAC8A9D|nr:F-box/SPRY domain-containing protein 1 isoform X1 [Rana temporaria]
MAAAAPSAAPSAPPPPPPPPPPGSGRLPGRVLELVFSYLELADLRSCGLVCKHWYRTLHGDENSEVWRSLCLRTVSEEALRTDVLCNLPTYKAKVRSCQHGFSSNDCSRNVYIKKNGFTLHRNPIAQSTDGARTKIGFSEGRHAWEVWWEGPLGTVAVIGIATKRAPMQCQGYVALLGSDDQSWGWNLVDNNLLHNGEVNGSFPQCNNAPKYQDSYLRNDWLHPLKETQIGYNLKAPPFPLTLSCFVFPDPPGASTYFFVFLGLVTVIPISEVACLPGGVSGGNNGVGGLPVTRQDGTGSHEHSSGRRSFA